MKMQTISYELERTLLQYIVFETPNPNKPSNLDWVALNLHRLSLSGCAFDHDVKGFLDI